MENEVYEMVVDTYKTVWDNFVFPYKKHEALSKKYAGGVKEYYLNERMKLLEEVGKTYIGRLWINSNMPTFELSTISNAYLSLYHETSLSKKTKWHDEKHNPEVSFIEFVKDDCTNFFKVFYSYTIINKKINDFDAKLPKSLNFNANNDEFKNRLYDLMLKIPIIEKTEKDMVFFALFGHPLKSKFNPIKFSNGRKDLLIYLFYKFSQITPDDKKSLRSDIRTNAVKLFDFNYKDKRLPNLNRYPSYYEKIDNLFENFPPTRK